MVIYQKQDILFVKLSKYKESVLKALVLSENKQLWFHFSRHFYLTLHLLKMCMQKFQVKIVIQLFIQTVVFLKCWKLL